MGTFGRSFSREIGKNTGKWASNKVFGNSGWATPRRHIIEVEERKQQREEAREYKERQKDIERERRGREREMKQLEREESEREKLEIIKANKEEVHEHNNYLEVIQSVHKSFSDQMNWQELQRQEEPQYVESAEELKEEIAKFTNDFIDKEIEECKRKSKLSMARFILGGMYDHRYHRIFKLFGNKVVRRLIIFLCVTGFLFAIFQEGFLKYLFIIISVLVFVIIRLFKSGAKDINRKIDLENELVELENSRFTLLEQNLNEQQHEHEQFLIHKEEYQKVMNIVEGVIAGDPQAYTYALNYFKPFEDLQEFGSDISCDVGKERISVNFYPHSEEVVPGTTKRILRKGVEIKEEQLPISRFNEIYQDYVCSCILKIAKEIFQLFPDLNEVQVNAKGSILNLRTGEFDEQTIVSVNIGRTKLYQLNFELLDPSDSMANFEHTMDFCKKEGFKPVSELQLT